MEYIFQQMKFKIQHPSNILKGNNMFDGHILHNVHAFIQIVSAEYTLLLS